MLSKKHIEDLVGYEIKDYEFSPVMVNDKCKAISVSVIPKTDVEFMDVKLFVDKNHV